MVEYASGLTVFCQSSEIAQLIEVLALTAILPVFWGKNGTCMNQWHGPNQAVRRDKQIEPLRKSRLGSVRGRAVRYSVDLWERLTNNKVTRLKRIDAQRRSIARTSCAKAPCEVSRLCGLVSDFRGGCTDVSKSASSEDACVTVTGGSALPTMVTVV